MRTASCSLMWPARTSSLQASIALMHACNDEVRAGHIDEHDAVRILTTSVRDLLTGPQPRR